MLLIQLVPLIQFNVYYTLHIKNNNRNNFLVNWLHATYSVC